jgi:UPF0755 protein
MRYPFSLQPVKTAIPDLWHWFFSLSSRQKAFVVVGKLAILCAIAVTIISSPPHAFPTSSIIVVPADANAGQFATILKENHIIRSRTAFMTLARITRSDHTLDPGAYVFKKPLDLSGVIWRAAHGEHGIEAVRLTFTEGMTVRDMGDTMKAALPGFNEDAFLNAASTSEGYLFPDTYLVTPGTPEDAIVVRLRTQFSTEIASITPQIMSFGKPFSDDVIMASILEREARTLPEKRMVAGILWKRIEKGIPLQVDAAFAYAHGRSDYVPTAEDTDIDSPYNTYKHQGLPPTPIANPGLESLLAAVTPTASPYLYYLTGSDGEMHYAKTYEEHQDNIEKYLK